MKFTLIAVSAFAALVAATSSAPRRRSGNTLGTRQANIFAPTTYNDIQISDGVAGNGQQEALDALSGLPDDLSTVSEDDIDFLNSVNQVCNDAEVEAFNPAIEAAAGAEADALECGKIKNKILKLTATVLKLQVQAAQGEDVADDMTEEQKKLDNNISQDEAVAGDACTAVDFDAAIPE